MPFTIARPRVARGGGLRDSATPASSAFTMRATAPYTASVMPSPTTASTLAFIAKLASPTTESVMAMISAERMKSVRMALATCRCSSCFGSAPDSSATDCFPWAGRTISRTLPKPSAHRNRPPRTSSGMIDQGARYESAIAPGSRNSSLLRTDPQAILPMIGNSRSAAKPTTYRGVTAASSMTMPAALLPALAACPTTSSREADAILAITATSSSRASKPEGMRERDRKRKGTRSQADCATRGERRNGYSQTRVAGTLEEACCHSSAPRHGRGYRTGKDQRSIQRAAGP